MYTWFRGASVCYTYLDDVEASPQDRKKFVSNSVERRYSEWFERGWTFQELLVPRRMKFYNLHWELIGTKSQLAGLLSRITGVQEEYLTGSKEFRKASIACKMSWQAKRKTKHIEDLAYSMLGIFNVELPVKCGIGLQAFRSLQEQLILQPSDESIFAWTFNGLSEKMLSRDMHTEDWKACERGLLAPLPACFQDSGDITNIGPVKTRRPGGYKLSQSGIEFSIPKPTKVKHAAATIALMPTVVGPLIYSLAITAHHKSKGKDLPLNCWRQDASGKKRAVQLWLKPETANPPMLKRVHCDRLGLSSSDRVPSSGNADAVHVATILQPEIEHWERRREDFRNA